MRNNTGKYKVGPGGIDCACCTKLPKNKLKIKIRRANRRKQKQSPFDDSMEYHQGFA